MELVCSTIEPKVAPPTIFHLAAADIKGLPSLKTQFDMSEGFLFWMPGGERFLACETML